MLGLGVPEKILLTKYFWEPYFIRTERRRRECAKPMGFLDFVRFAHYTTTLRSVRPRFARAGGMTRVGIAVSSGLPRRVRHCRSLLLRFAPCGRFADGRNDGWKLGFPLHRSEREQESAASRRGVYNDVNDPRETQARRTIATLICCGNSRDPGLRCHYERRR